MLAEDFYEKRQKIPHDVYKSNKLAINQFFNILYDHRSLRDLVRTMNGRGLSLFNLPA